MGSRPRRISKVLLVVVLLFWAGRAEAQWRVSSCSTTGQNLFVRDVLSDIYLWYTTLPPLDPADYASPEAYLEAVRYRPLDCHFSFITSRQANDAYYNDSEYVGFGVSWAVRSGALRVQQVFAGGPAAEAGIARGDRIVSIAGHEVSDLIATGKLDTTVGIIKVGAAVTVQFVNQAGTTKSARIAKRVVAIPPVSNTTVYLVNGRRVGYVFFRNFVTPSASALDAAFAQLKAAGVDELIVDLRYNGGGLISVAQHLASLVAGVRTAGQVLAEYTHNDKNAARNQVLRFESPSGALNLSRLVVIATQASASASELVINALRAYMPVAIIGDRTYGKPVGQYQVDFCDKTLFPVSFTVRNALGEGDFFNGLPADCPAPDDVDHQIGDVEEASLREALVFAATGACSPSTTRLRTVTPASSVPRATGWQALVNAD